MFSTTENLKYYFEFIENRMDAFWCKNNNIPFKGNEIISRYKFTNVYRCLDRTSQFLINDIILKHEETTTPEDMLFKILLFKHFNKIETWEFILTKFKYEDIKYSKEFLKQLSSSLREYNDSTSTPIYSGAYVMFCIKNEPNQRRYDVYFDLYSKEIENGLFERQLNSKTLCEVYEEFRKIDMHGDFLSMQYSIDFNYSKFLNHSENDFIIPGLGCVRGIDRCFTGHTKSNINHYIDILNFMKDNFSKLYEDLTGNDFSILKNKLLPNHDLTLIDIQNCFCETDKYLRAVGDKTISSLSSKPKQYYKPISAIKKFYFPKKYNMIPLEFEGETNQPEEEEYEKNDLF